METQQLRRLLMMLLILHPMIQFERKVLLWLKNNVLMHLWCRMHISWRFRRMYKLIILNLAQTSVVHQIVKKYRRQAHSHYLLHVYKGTKTRRSQGWNKHLPGGVDTSLREVSVGYKCPLWHHIKGQISRTNLVHSYWKVKQAKEVKDLCHFLGSSMTT